MITTHARGGRTLRMDAIEAGLGEAARAIAGARALLVTAGAGMGVDSGLPDFRGDQGFWRAYRPYQKLGLSFVDLANPKWFARDPELAWGFYGHRLELYRRTTPHAGFALLRAWSERCRDGAFVFTSNVDGQFQRAGFPDARIVECHGSLSHLQCTRACGAGIVTCDDVRIDVDEATFRARAPLPACPACGALARPNVLMFGDGEWDDRRTAAQVERMERWLSMMDLGSVVVVECGAGTAVPSVRNFGDGLARQGATVIRINLREPEIHGSGIGLPLTALDALQRLDAMLGSRG